MITEFKIWQTITLGTRIGGPHYCELIDAKTGLYSVNYAQTLLKSHGFTISANPYEIDLVHVGVTDLGFTEHEATYEEVCARAVERGLVLCPADAGPELYLKIYLGRYSAGSGGVIMGMVPIEDDTDGELHVFDMDICHPHQTHARFGRCHVRARHKDDNEKPLRLVWSNYQHFVFVLPRKKEFKKQEGRAVLGYRETKDPSVIRMLNPAIFPGLR